ncbi:MAG: type IV-A pilus assembly ATPase PilB [Halothiobacillus sp. 24-54-40]|jgi:type IV pilus assembly protein PilB|nr:MAG: type IV-A pilus assembly ATPase PilB [Halothiobacillus sp. 35-54-62]OYZ88279.1 MAG: type IV-A pilus assembly ATPase PilB [Halothiobacillus sp. 24-54-40]OZA81309.1 MAG: type IV-A pilus assembly ATPase PilB [Halothiobacillus sp. 39-53-45]HQS01947.1 type IV-A pilus assembly ATPase PilB [Halothiobacillus sp.]HQS28775.1 type IV-A pilus assembly ATPase PilB [Halothiobacillus sp.]
MTPPAITGLLAALVKTAVLEPARALELLEKSRSTKEPLLQTLMANGVSAIKIARAASQNYGLPQIDLDSFDTSDLPINIVPAKLLQSGNALPLRKRGRRLTVAMADPSDLGILENFRFSTNLTIDVVVAEATKIARLLEEAANNSMAGMADLDDDLANIQIEGENFATDEKSDDPLQDDIVVKFVTKVLTDAIRRKASDIHIEPYEKQFRIRVRIDGILTEVPPPPRQLADRIVSRIKVMSRMDISERRVPQDGRIKLKLSAGRSIDFRVNSCPTLFGEKIVLRILDPTSAQLGIDSLGYEEDQKQLYLKALNRPYGMILITGPTGSGKTVSLYTGLNVLNTMDRNISTAEDPAEIVVPGINQVNVNAKVGLTFAAALRAFLRQDPDVIMVGEIRDLETAEIAIKAAQTGHLVLSTLHTNDAPQTLTRLMNMGVPGYNIASSVNLIIAQRLARRLCNSCKKVDHIPDEELLREGFNPIDVQSGMKIFKAVGCDQCTNGYRGRMGIYQVMPVSEEMGRIIMRGGNAIELAEQATKEGINDLRQSGIRKVKAGITSLEELNRVTKD